MQKSRSARPVDLLLPILFQFILLLQSPTRTSGIRADASLQGKQQCKTTVQGRYLISDDNGHVCDALSLNSRSRCCPEMGERFSCQGCNLISRCCNTYEYCVSCCLNPVHTQKDLALKLKIAKPVTAGTYSSVFDFCSGRCRHSSASVVHENAYISDFHHCFSVMSNSSGVAVSRLEARLAGINIVTGRQGESCSSACESKGQSCVPGKLLVLNSCELLQKYMSCKGDCLASMGMDQPAEVVDDAPKHLVLACIHKCQQCFLVKVLISKPGDFAPVHSIFRLLIHNEVAVEVFTPAAYLRQRLPRLGQLTREHNGNWHLVADVHVYKLSFDTASLSNVRVCCVPTSVHAFTY